MNGLPVRMFLPFPAVAGVLLLMAGGALAEAGSSAGTPVLVAGLAALVSVGLMWWRTIPGGVMAVGIWMVFMAWCFSLVPDEYGPSTGQCLLFGGAGVALVLLGWAVGRRPGTRTLVAHQSERSDRNNGVASRWQLLRHASRWPIRRKTTVLRPSFADLPIYKRPFVKINELATKVATVGMIAIWSAIEDVIVYLGGPRTGKTGTLACRIIDAPGAVIATSTRTDLIEHTAEYRAETKGPVYVFNPSGLGELASTITFDPLVGCADPVTAGARAGDLLSAVDAPGGGDSAYWTEQAQRVLAMLMHAGSLAPGVAMADVLAWVSDPDGAKDEIQRYLRRSPVSSYVQDSLQFLNTNDRTRSSICSTIMPALGWLTNPTAAAAASGGGFDVDGLLAERGTVYLLGAEEAKTAPLVAALTGHIARQARQIASVQPKGRLDPPLTLVLDEAALICPVPLDKWTADMGGRNITIHIAAQSRAQMEAKFGDKAARAILNNTATLLLFGGTKDADDLQAFSTLIGEYAEDVDTTDETGHVSTTNRRSPILDPARLAQMQPGHVVIVRRFMPAAIGRVAMVWKRRDLRWWHRRRQLAALAAEWRDGIAEAYQWCRPRVQAAYAEARPYADLAIAWTAQRLQSARAWLGRRAEVLADRASSLKRQPHQNLDGPIALPPAAADVLDLSDRHQRSVPDVDELVDDDANNGSVTSLDEWRKGDAS